MDAPEQRLEVRVAVLFTVDGDEELLAVGRDRESGRHRRLVVDAPRALRERRFTVGWYGKL